MMSHFPMVVPLFVTQLLHKGIIYLSGRDTNLRPVVVVNLRKLWDLKPFPSADAVSVLLTLYLSIIEQIMMEKGITESFVFIIDCRGIGWWNTPFLECRRVANVLINLFKAKV